MKTYLSLFAILISGSLFAQSNTGLILEYNLHDDEVSYIQDNMYVVTPSVEVGENIKVIIKEFNPYIQKATIKVDKINYSQTTSGLEPNEYGEYESSGFKSDGISSLMGNLTMGADIGSVFSGFPGTRGASSQEVLRMKSEFNALTEELNNAEQKINVAFEKIQLFGKAEKSKKLALADINGLKINPHIRPSRVREMIQEEIRYAFAKVEGEEIDIDDLLDEMEKEKELENSIENYDLAKEEYKKVSKKWNAFDATMSIINNNSGDQQLDFIQNSTDSIVEVIGRNVSKFNKLQTDSLKVFDSEQNIERMSELRQVYEEVKNNNFTYSFAPIQADGDKVIIDISVFQKDELGNYIASKNLVQKIPVTGGWKITGGVGLAFGTFTKETYAYTVSNNIIVADEQDAFIPIIASFAHIHKNSNKNFSVGGSFGIGLPLLGANNVKAASFFVGPTGIIGKSQRFLITAGIMGAKAERLSEIYQVGDMFDNTTEFLPLNEKYEMGFFIGISYNVIN